MKLRIANSRFQIGDARRGPAPLEIVNLPRRCASTAGRQSSTCRDGARARRVVNPVAFSLIEILVVIALLSAIIVGLLVMFNQTQRAFRAGMTQVDVLGSGRIVTDMIVRELEQITPSQQPAINFYVWLTNIPPLVQSLPGGGAPRTNLLEDLFFVYRRNQEWVGIGYFVRTNDLVTGNVGVPVTGPNPQHVGAGVLYRFETSAFPLTQRGPANLYADFANVAYASQWPGNTLPATRIMDGVAHFKVRAYDTNGMWITQNLHDPTDNTDIQPSGFAPGEVGQYIFYSNAVPAAVELEIGILEDRAWDRFRSIPNPTVQGNYLVTNTIGSMHLFRQRIPIRNVDPAAYQ